MKIRFQIEHMFSSVLTQKHYIASCRSSSHTLHSEEISSPLYLFQPPPSLSTSHPTVNALGGVTMFLIISEQEHNCIE